MAYTRLHINYYLNPTSPNGVRAYRIALLNALTCAYVEAVLMPGLEAYLNRALHIQSSFLKWRAYEVFIKSKCLGSLLQPDIPELTSASISAFLHENHLDYTKALDYLYVFKHFKVEEEQFKACLPEILINKLVKDFPMEKLLPNENTREGICQRLSPDNVLLIQKLTNTLIFIL